MKSAFLIMMIVMSLWKGNVGEASGSDSSDFRFAYASHEHTPEEVGFAPGTEVKKIQGWYMNGYQITPKEVKHKGAVVVFGGSEGGCGLPSAISLVNEGYEVYAMYFYGKENQRKEIDRIPLEFFLELYLHIQKTAQSARPLTIEGTSAGAELVLVFASYFPKYVDHIILYAPSSYVFQGSVANHHSSWTFQGRELPFIAMDREEIRTKQLIAHRNKKRVSMTEYYRYALELADNKEEARIDLTPVQTKMLIFAGELDAICPAADAGREIKENYKGECELVVFEKAGHSFSSYTAIDGMWELGGEPEANVQAGIISDRIRLEKLAEWTK